MASRDGRPKSREEQKAHPPERTHVVVHLFVLFFGGRAQGARWECGRVSSVCALSNTHLDDATAAIIRQCTTQWLSGGEVMHGVVVGYVDIYMPPSTDPRTGSRQVLLTLSMYSCQFRTRSSPGSAAG